MSYTDATPEFRVPAGQERDTTMARFYMETVEDKAASTREGKPMFMEREKVEIHVPGDRNTVVDRLVNDEHRNRWPRLYAAFKARETVPLEGTPIGEWAAIGRAQAEELKYAHILTVEILADLPDDALRRAVKMGGVALRDKAQRWLKDVNDRAPMEKLAAEGAAKDAKIAVLEQQMADMTARVNEMLAQQQNGA